MKSKQKNGDGALLLKLKLSAELTGEIFDAESRWEIDAFLSFYEPYA